MNGYLETYHRITSGLRAQLLANGDKLDIEGAHRYFGALMMQRGITGGLSELEKRLFSDFPEASVRVASEPPYIKSPYERVGLFKYWLLSIVGDYYSGEAKKDYAQIFGEDEVVAMSREYDLWKGLAQGVHAMSTIGHARITDDEISIDFPQFFLLSKCYLHDISEQIELYDAVDDEHTSQWLQIIENGQSPFLRNGVRIEFKSRIAYQALIADLVTEDNPYNLTNFQERNITPLMVINNMNHKGLFDAGMYEKHNLAISLAAEKFLAQYPPMTEEFIEIIVSLARRIGGREGFQFAREVLDDIARYRLEENEQPIIRYPEDRVGIQNVAIVSAYQRLAQAERDFLYPNRQHVLPTETLQSAHTKLSTEVSSAFFEEIFAGTVEDGEIEALFDPRVRTLIHRVLAAAHDRRKAEAAIIPLFADVYGYDRDTAIWLEKLMQVIWASIIVNDDVYDYHKVRDGQDTVHTKVGKASAAESALLTILQVTNDVVSAHKDAHLAEAFTAMLKDVYRGDIQNRNIGWDDEKQVFD